MTATTNFDDVIRPRVLAQPRESQEIPILDEFALLHGVEDDPGDVLRFGTPPAHEAALAWVRVQEEVEKRIEKHEAGVFIGPIYGPRAEPATHARTRTVTYQALVGEVRARLDEMTAQLAAHMQSVHGQIAAERASRREIEDARRADQVARFNEVAAVYMIAEPVPVAFHIACHGDIDKALIAAARELRERFGETDLNLYVDEERLVLCVDTALSAEEADQRYAAFIHQWWIRNVTPEHATAVTLNFV